MGFYKNESDDAFFPAIYITEDNVLERQTQAHKQEPSKSSEPSTSRTNSQMIIT